ncbi:AAA family ATPase [uncultured Oscillibacter sp.]|uniref:AAA family ATPase n=1 Tax=uncultured Oscillibacter sp. TaxID=876091 RepID=UPI0026037B10|nr:AAA family ATPase [uncultured Oscillibacter sp.]
MTLRSKMLSVCADVNDQVAEREELVELIAIALLTRKNLFLLGAPGQAKSYAINAFRSRITGARQFERLLSKQTDEEQLFGRIDLSSLIPGSVPQDVLEKNPQYQEMCGRLKARLANGQSAGDLPEQIERQRKALSELYSGEPKVNTAGKIPEADIVFLDECFKANDGVLNSLLTALNERKYTNEGRTYPIPTISFFAASNEIPNFADPQEKILEALYDRLDLKVVTENISDRAKRLAILRDKQTGRAGQIAASFTLEELKEMQKEVSDIPVSDSVNELADDILCELRKGGVPVSDRKYLNYYLIAQAKAWLSGHTAVEPIDLLALKNYLWQKPGDRAVVEATLNRMCVNPMQDKVNSIQAMALEALNDFDDARESASKPSGEARALQKFRGELVRLYGMQQDLVNAAQSDSERALADSLLEDLEQSNRQASQSVNFTCMPLNELAAMQ